jgi:ribulose-bisphosphate carboxylase large chain
VPHAAPGMPKTEWYDEFVDASARPGPDDVVALFRFECDRGISTKEALGRIASESSVGTWTTLAQLPKRIPEMKAIAYKWTKNTALVTYPAELWEPGNMPQLLSGVAGNIFGMKAVKWLRLLDVRLPAWYLKGFRGPHDGIPGLRRRLKIPHRPLTATVPKPKLGWSAEEHATLGFEAWMGGMDLIKDDENLTNQAFNRFERRVQLLTKQRKRAEKETGEVKSALINVTAETKEAIRRAKVLHDNGWEYAMIDVVTTGWGALQTLRDEFKDLDLAIHAHRAMHAMFTKDETHGMAMPCLAKLLRCVGVDQLHAGTVVGKLVSPEHEVLGSADTLRLAKVKAREGLLDQDWGRHKPAFPVASGGLHTGIVPDVMQIFGNDQVIQLGGGVHGHPDGTRAGAKALLDVIWGTMDHHSLKEIAERSPPVRRAVEKWGTSHPK